LLNFRQLTITDGS
jgi:hypothetical protein